MATTQILPSATGGGLERGARNFADERARRRGQALEDRKQDSVERQINLQEQAGAFDRMLRIAPLMAPGTTIGENPFLLGTARTAFGDLSDEEFSALGGMELNRETAQTLIDDRLKTFIGGLDPENPDDQALLDRMQNAGIGLGAVSSESLGLEDDVTGMTRNLFDEMSEDHTLQGKLVAQALGVEPTVVIPGIVDRQTGEDIVFDSLGVAQLYVAIANNREDNDTERLALDNESANDIITQLMDQAAKDDIGLGRAFASNIVQSYNASVGPDVVLDDAGLRPLEALYAGASPDEQRAIDLFVGTIRIGDNEYEKLLRSSPAGRDQLLLGGLGEFISESLNIPSEDARATMADFLDSDVGRTLGIEIDENLLLRDKFIFEPGVAGERGDLTVPLGADGLPATADLDVVAAANVLRRGEMSEEEVRAEMGDSVVDAAIKLNAENR